MITVFSDKHLLHHGVELKDGAVKPSFEEPQRVDTILARVRQQGLGDVRDAVEYDRSCYVAAHSERYVRFLELAWSQWSANGRTHDALPLVWPVRGLPSTEVPSHIDGQLGYFSMDAGAPIARGTWEAVRGSADAALTATDVILKGARGAFALCRPPGHHAARELAGGYCYLNNAAIAAQRAREQGATKVAILDVDFHHGNGTQDIFYARDDVLFVSIHGDPRHSYPFFSGYANEEGVGVGQGYTLNLPLAWNTGWIEYECALNIALQRCVVYRPDLLVISLGVDTFEGDPISHFKLSSDDYLRMGEQIAATGIPALFVMEGGYMVDEIGINTVNTLQGFEGSR